MVIYCVGFISVGFFSGWKVSAIEKTKKQKKNRFPTPQFHFGIAER